ncbi:hypothetical protein WSM22_09540 [Cytophagales bacterium WSM2-2]|nr:hypothetical protein WSM22_09540 [Cytophagales bacterium WSM2-2]
MKTTLLALLIICLSLACSKDNLAPSNKASYENLTGVVLGDIRGSTQVLLEDGKIISALTNILPGYVHDSAFFKLKPGTRVLMSFEVHPYCDGKTCVTPDLSTEAFVFLKRYEVENQSAFNPAKDSINPDKLKSILSRSEYFGARSISSNDNIRLGLDIRTIFNNDKYEITFTPPNNKTVARGTFLLTDHGTIRFTQTYLDQTSPTIELHHLLSGEYHYFHYVVDNLSEDGTTHATIHHPTDNIILWKDDEGQFSVYKLEAPIKW